jgi:hypothetical protein
MLKVITCNCRNKFVPSFYICLVLQTVNSTLQGSRRLAPGFMETGGLEKISELKSTDSGTTCSVFVSKLTYLYKSNFLMKRSMKKVNVSFHLISQARETVFHQ